MKPILVGLDGSELAERGLVLAADIAEGLDAKVIAARVVSKPQLTHYEVDLLRRIEEADEQEAKSYLSGVLERLRSDRISAETRLLHGDPAGALNAAARQDDCGMITITSHGMGGLGSRVFGSVAQKLLAGAHCPVLVVPCTPPDLVSEEEVEEAATDRQALERIASVAAAHQPNS